MINEFKNLLKTKILLFDGAMGTMIQTYKLNEADYRGRRFADHPGQLMGANDLLCLTQPEIIEKIHTDYLQAGADIIETNTFNANGISMRDYDLVDLVYEINYQAAQIARKAARKITDSNPSKPRFVAGSLGPTNATLSLSPDVNNPAYRAVEWEEMVEAYYQQVCGLVD
ncbi:MAG: homocysteine S-methyltransferase family protein, partial [Calditrichaeota bacterium]|nr:homocysteine S-methyltransferase family protein [Calditrichota bacterium]